MSFRARAPSRVAFHSRVLRFRSVWWSFRSMCYGAATEEIAASPGAHERQRLSKRLRAASGVSTFVFSLFLGRLSWFFRLQAVGNSWIYA